jgi:hypothetical protein
MVEGKFIMFGIIFVVARRLINLMVVFQLAESSLKKLLGIHPLLR